VSCSSAEESGKDVFRNFFGAENILRQQVEAEIKER
jgi:hypothetical protein